VLLAPGGRPEEIAHLVMSPAEAGGAGVRLEASHRLVAELWRKLGDDEVKKATYRGG